MLPLFSMIGGGGGYRADAVQFDGSNDYLTRGAELAGIADGKEGAVSFWMDLTGGDDGLKIIFMNGVDANFRLSVARLANNKFQVAARTSAPTIILQIVTVATYTASGGWIHFLSSWNQATGGARHIYVNDASDLSVTTFTNDTIDYVANGNWAIGGETDGSAKISADIADFWFDDAYIDITTEANRRKFINPNGKPVNLGEAGQLPTGSAPLVFQSGPTVAWHTNLGTGGGFTENGALTDGSSSPSD